MGTAAVFIPRVTCSIWPTIDSIGFSDLGRSGERTAQASELARRLLLFRPVINGQETGNVAAGGKCGPRRCAFSGGHREFGRKLFPAAERKPAIDRWPAAADGKAHAAGTRNRPEAGTAQGTQ